MKSKKKIVLAYSGGLDTSIILKWLQEEYKAEVITFTADLGQGEEVEPARQKALDNGIKPENIFILDVQEEFVKELVTEIRDLKKFILEIETRMTTAQKLDRNAQEERHIKFKEDIKALPTPIVKETFPPSITLAKISLPNLSVPKG